MVPDWKNPQSLNRYSYVWNNPLKYTDPTGHWGWSNIKRFVSDHKKVIVGTAAVVGLVGLTIATGGAGAVLAGAALGAGMQAGVTVASNKISGRSLTAGLSGWDITQAAAIGGFTGYALNGLQTAKVATKFAKGVAAAGIQANGNYLTDVSQGQLAFNAATWGKINLISVPAIPMIGTMGMISSEFGKMGTGIIGINNSIGLGASNIGRKALTEPQE